MKMEQTECSETSAYKFQMLGNYPEENIQHTEHGESLKSRIPVISLEEITSVTCEYILPIYCLPIFMYISQYPETVLVDMTSSANEQLYEL